MLQVMSLKEMSCPQRKCHVLASVALVLLYFHVGHAVSHQCPQGCAGAVAEPSHGTAAATPRAALGQPH